MKKGMLIDLTRCMGCRGCQVACKQWNDLPAEKTSIGAEFTNPQNRSAYTWSIIEFKTAVRAGRTVSTFTKTQCMHCDQPACESGCIAKAIRKTALGPVIVDHNKCIGCRYCMLACPFGVPKYEYDKSIPKMQKCTMCYNRVSVKMQPACSATCPNSAILFGNRTDLAGIARKRIAQGRDRYVDYVYGEHEAGGTSVLYLSPVPLELTALRQNVTEDAAPDFTWKAMRQIPAMLGVVGIASLGLLAYTNRRAAIEAETEQEK